MSYSRRNWSDLSSLAKQRTLEDEEEQQRERRRRHRSLLSSSSVDEEPLSPVKDPSPTPSRPQSLVKPVSPEEEEERKLSEVLKTQEGRRTRSPMAMSEKPKQEKEQPKAVQGASCEQAQPHTGQESGRAADQGQDAATGKEAPPGDQHPEPARERKVVVRGRLQDKEGQGAGTPRGEQRRDEGEPQQQAAPELGTCRVREVKILTRTRIRSTEEKIASEGTPSPDQQHPPRSPLKEVIQPPPTQDEPPEKSETSRNYATYSSSIRRSSPRTVSFRVISKKQKEEDESPLTRSASLRIPGSNTTIEEKLEKYTSAVQRSGSVRSSVTVQKSLVVTSEGVASKRNFFETSAPSKAEPLTAKKDNLKIPGSVTSRINLWISRTQEPAKEEKSKDVGKINSLPKRDVWVKQPRDASAGTKVDVELR